MIPAVKWFEDQYGVEIECVLEQVRKEQAEWDFVYWPKNGSGCITAAGGWWL